MPFWGSDTDQLRDLAELGRARIRALTARRALTVSAVRSVPWDGPDAEAFQEMWTALESRWSALEERARGVCAELDSQAAAQDATSGAEGRTAAGGAAPDGAPAPAADGRTPLGPRVETDGPAHPGETTARPAVLPMPDGAHAKNAGLPAPDGGSGGAPSSEEHDNPEDEFPTSAGEGTTKTTTKVETDAGSAEITEDGHGNASTTIETKVPLIGGEGEVESKGRSASADIQREVSTSGQARDNGNGTVTYTIDSKMSDSVKAEVEARYGASAGAGRSSSDTYEVTVPKGTPLKDVLAINPYDPDSIPRGASVVYSSTDEDSREGSASANLVTVSGERTRGEGTSTSITRDDNGSLTLATGPTETIKDRAAVAVGDPMLNVHLSEDDTEKDSSVEVAKFLDTQEGHRAYARAISEGRFPTGEEAGVSGTYTERQTSRTVDVTGGVTAGPVTHDSTTNSFTKETIERTYPSGHTERAEQWIPQGDRSVTSVVASSSSDRAPTYVLTSPTGHDEAIRREYGADAPLGEKSSIVLTQAEADRVAKGARAWGQVPPDASTAEALSVVMSTARTSDDAIVKLDNFHNVKLDDQGRPVGFDDGARAPGRIIDPTTSEVRDGEVVQRRPDPRGKALASG